MVAIAGTEGFAAATVTAVCARARLSRQTFYGHFQSREDCFLAVLDEAHDHARELVMRSFKSAGCWRDGLLQVFAELLVLFESRPDIARIWMVESLAAGPWALERRERGVVALTEEIVAYWQPPLDASSHPMAPMAVMTAALSAIQSHLVSRAPEAPITLLGPLMGIATDPFLDAEGVMGEIRRGDRLGREISSGVRTLGGLTEDGLVGIPSALCNPRAHRLRACLLHLASHPCASNRRIADASGISSDSQISALLARLAEMDLVDRKRGRRGLANTCKLTPAGEAVARALVQHPVWPASPAHLYRQWV